jgi:dual-specificity kinase
MKKLPVRIRLAPYPFATLEPDSNNSFQETIPPHTAFNRQFLDLLKRIFVYDPKKRITAKEALQHPWFKESLMDDGTEAHKIRLDRERKARRLDEDRRYRERAY